MKNKKDEYLSRNEQLTIGYALQLVAKSLTKNKLFVASDLGAAVRYLNEAINSIDPLPELSEEEGNLSSSLHTYLRKYEDSHIGSILYTFINEDRGKRVWYTFVKNLLSEAKLNKKNFNLFQTVDKLDLVISDDRNMKHLLHLWNDLGGLKDAVEMMREDFEALPNETENNKD